MSKFAEQTCEDKRIKYMQLLEEYLAAQFILELALLDSQSRQEIDLCERNVNLSKDDMQAMYDAQDSRCTLPTIEQAITLHKIGYYTYRKDLE